MKLELKYKLFIIYLACGLCSSNAQKNELYLWYESPADATQIDSTDTWLSDTEWVKALPLGNGSLGAMVYGDVFRERIQLNEETIWSGSPYSPNNPNASKYQEEIKNLLLQEKYKDANSLASKTQVCLGKGSGKGKAAELPFGCYQTLGDLWIDFDNKLPYSNYKRSLNLDKATINVEYSQGNVNYYRELFISHPDQALIIHLYSDKKEQISFKCSLSRPERYKTFKDYDELVMKGSLSNGKGGDGLNYMVRLKAIPKNGYVNYTDSILEVKNADEVTLLLTASSDYLMEYPECKGRDYESVTKKNINNASCKSYEELYKNHVEDYSKFYNRVSFSLGSNCDSIPTDKRIQNAINGSVDMHLYELLFQYGRYLLISSSRPGGLPANLQGIWANRIQNPWNCDYHTNINLEMNYWLAEITNLSEMHTPLFDYISFLTKPGSETAKVQYSQKGWIVHSIANVWGYTSPGEKIKWGFYIGAGAWLCQHISEHFRFTNDKDFIKKMYPVLKSAVEFYLDWLIVDRNTNKMVSKLSTSPENTYYSPNQEVCSVCIGSSHDQQVIKQLFRDFIMISDSLSINNNFVDSVKICSKLLKDVSIGKDGRIMEWDKEYEEPEPGHRHLSHLYFLYPGTYLDRFRDLDLMEAAQKTIAYKEHYGGGYIPWNSAWLINLFARLNEPEKSLKNIDLIIKKHINPNLFIQRTPFQIEANFGVASGIAEMLLQSDMSVDGEYILHLLPALPECWKNGEIAGLKARGGFDVSIEWDNESISKVVIKSLNGNDCKVYYKGEYLNVIFDKYGEWKYEK